MDGAMDSEWLGREDEVDAAWRELALRSFLLTGPRRIGKTELLKHLAQHPREGWRVVRIDVQAARDTQEGLARLRDGLNRANLGPKVLAKAAGQVESLQIAGVRASIRAKNLPDVWSQMGTDLAAALSHLKEKQRLVIALDEVPWWVAEIRKLEGDNAARTALSGLRHLRERDDLKPRTRWILTGSVGLTGLAKALNASAEINDVLPQVLLGPLKSAAGQTLFEMLTTDRGLQCDADASKLGCAEAGGSPHWIRWLAGRAASRVQEAGSKVTTQHVQGALADIESDRLGRVLFDDEGRVHLLKAHGPDDARIAAAILTAAAEAQGPISTSEIQSAAQQVMSRPDRRKVEQIGSSLINAWYLDEVGDGSLRFVNPLFQRWWGKFGEIP